jgi:rubrerythrin
MRVNHTGEVCAQALYAAQAMVARDPAVKARFAAAAREEEDHLAWTQSRLDELAQRRRCSTLVVRRRIRIGTSRDSRRSRPIWASSSRRSARSRST